MSRRVILGFCVALVFGCAGCRETPNKPEPAQPEEWPWGKISEVKEGMTVEQAEAIMGNGQKGTVFREECLAWDYKAHGKPAKVWVKIKDGKVSEIGTGNFRPRSRKRGREPFSDK
jgi:hypothetical protein